MKHSIPIFFVCALALVLTACPANTLTPVATDPDVATVEQARDALQIGYELGDSSFSVTQNITLPTSGANGVNISWASDNLTAISTSGIVTRPGAGQQDAAVIMTATLTKNSIVLTKTFNLTVLAEMLGFIKTNDWQTFSTVTTPVVYSVIQDGTKIYVGTSANGLVYSDNSGTSWNILKDTDGIASNQIYAVKKSGDLLFLGTYYGLTVWNTSTSTGNNYLAGKQVYDIVINGGTIYLATSAGIYSVAIASIGDLNTATPYATSFEYPKHLFLEGTSLYASGASSDTNPEEVNIFSTANMSLAPAEIDVAAGTQTSVGPVYVNGQTILVGIDYALYRSTNGGTSFVEDLGSGSGTITGFANTGTYLIMVKYGSSLWYSSDTGATWSYVDVPGYTSFAGIIANGVFWNGTELMIAHSKGVVTGKLE